MSDDTRTFSQLVKSLCRPGQVTILGLTGQAGAGKTNHMGPLVKVEAERQGHPVTCLGLDAFFRLSSQGRKRWIAEGDVLGGSESIRRRDQINWWDFERSQAGLDTLRRGEPLHLRDIYNRSDGGELTGSVDIEPSEKGLLVVFDGVAVCHLEGLDETMFVYAPADVRLERLRSRDPHRQGPDVIGRFMVTQAFELRYFPGYWHEITSWVDNSVDHPQMLESLHHTHALSQESVSSLLSRVK